MLRITLASGAALALTATPTLAASGPFFSLGNTNFIVLLAFLLFIAILVYFKVPSLLGKELDKRADGIRSELDEARQLREEAQALLASYERQQSEVQGHADRIVAQARDEAAQAAEQAKQDMQRSIERRLATAEAQITAAEERAVKDVRDRAVVVAIAAARDVIAAQMTEDEANRRIDASITEVSNKLH